LRYWPVAVIVLLLAVAALGANARGPRVTQVAPPRIVPTGTQPQQARPTPSFVSRPPQPHGGTSDWIVVVVIAALCAVVYGAVLLYLMLALRNGLVLRRRRRPEPEPEPEPPEAPTSEQVRAAMAASRAALITGDDPRAAVIACWLTLEDLAARGGIARETSDTATDLVARMLGGTELTEPATRALRALAERYRSARYAPAPVTEADRDAARAALDRLAAELTVRDAAPAEER